MSQLATFEVDKHEKFFNRFLLLLPSKLQSEDSNRLALIYFSLHGLGLLKRLNFSKEELIKYSQFIYNDFLIENEEFVAFRATSAFKQTPEYDFGNLSATLFALLNLLILESDYSSKLNNHKVMKFLSMLQVKEGEHKGSFVPTLREVNGKFEQYGESDLRLCYIAASIRHLMRYDSLSPSERINDIDTSALTEFVLNRINFSGGLSAISDVESHLGFTYCGIGCLRLLNYKFGPEFDDTISWLVHRQVDYPAELYNFDYEYHQEEDIGSFNGRDNKFGDTCYSWWCTGSLALIEPKNLSLVDLDRAKYYLLNTTQNQLLGGFSKDPDSNPDPYHSFLAIASLALWQQYEDIIIENGATTRHAESSSDPEPFKFDGIDEALVITKKSKEFFQHTIHY
ncbi:geranylgeranyltransferase beta subunit [Scheffersomyces xylosifermentans]|uniref:geranylgeranyltransferase beta subunit n=1 Tax=Scheffersomyces xylosifermentans TaxID=1304137 RepID=UPI00315DD63A